MRDKKTQSILLVLLFIVVAVVMLAMFFSGKTWLLFVVYVALIAQFVIICSVSKNSEPKSKVKYLIITLVLYAILIIFLLSRL